MVRVGWKVEGHSKDTDGADKMEYSLLPVDTMIAASSSGLVALQTKR